MVGSHIAVMILHTTVNIDPVSALWWQGFAAIGDLFWISVGITLGSIYWIDTVEIGDKQNRQLQPNAKFMRYSRKYFHRQE